MPAGEGKVEICEGENGAKAYRITIPAADAKRLFGWMQLAGVCLQTWPGIAHDLLLQAKELRLI